MGKSKIKAVSPVRGMTASHSKQRIHSKPCWCRGQGTCITCGWWWRAKRINNERREGLVDHGR